MIAYLKGEIIFKSKDYLAIAIGGVGYQVFVSPVKLADLKKGQIKEFFVYHQISDYSSHLFGFSSQSELELFQLLISVSGIGPKVGLRIMSVASAGHLVNAIAQEDVAGLSLLPGIGKKSAQRMIAELKDKVAPLAEKTLGRQSLADKVEAAEALLSLGYSRSQAEQTLAQVPARIKDTAERVKQALRILAGL